MMLIHEHFDLIIESILIFLLLVTSFKIIISAESNKNHLINLILLAISSLLYSIIYILFGAADVAITEVSIGACVSSVLYLATYKILYKNCFFYGQVPKNSLAKKVLISSYIIILYIAIMLFLRNMPEFNSLNSPVNQEVNSYYINSAHLEIGINSIVAAILASYRAFDTMGETFVIFIAGIAIMLILSFLDDEVEDV